MQHMFYGGEANEAIRFMMEPELVETPILAEATEAWLAELEAEQRQVEDLNVVRRVYFSYGDTNNENKAWATLWCCWQGGRFKAMSVPCLEGARPTHLEALRQLHTNILKEHAIEGHAHHSKATARRAEVERSIDGDAETTSAENAFERSRLAMALQQRTQAQVASDEGAVAEARTR